jgi:hypothetical protein
MLGSCVDIIELYTVGRLCYMHQFEICVAVDQKICLVKPVFYYLVWNYVTFR